MLKLPTILFLVMGSLLAVSHVLALKLSLYWQYLWLDIPMHMLGGLLASLGVFTIYDLYHKFPKRLLLPIPVLLFVLVVALAWEVYELQIGIPVESGYAVDTAIDLIVGMLGGVLGYMIGYSVSQLDLNEEIV